MSDSPSPPSSAQPTNPTGDRPPARPQPGQQPPWRHLPAGGGWRKVIGPIIGVASFAGAVVLTLTVWDIMEHHPRTDDAFLRANTVGVAPRVSGQLVKINVVDNQAVKAGDLLFEVDPADYQLSLDRAQSSLAALDQQIAVARAQDANLEHQIKAAMASDESAKLQLKQADDTLQRLEPLLPRGFASADDVDKARTGRDVAAAALAMQEQKLQEARTIVSPLGQLLAQRPGAQAEVKQAALNLSYCQVLAPVPGRIINLNISVGNYVAAGQPVFSMLDTRHWYVIADYREGELRHFGPGTRADVYLLADPHRRYEGRVQSLGYGVQPNESETDTPGQLPNVTRELNWVHIAQRFPVRIEIEQPDQEQFRMGASAIAVIKN